MDNESEAEAFFRRILGVNDGDRWTLARLWTPQILVLGATTLFYLAGALLAHWKSVDFIMAYLAEITAFAFWYGARAVVIAGRASVSYGVFSVAFGILVAYGLPLGFLVFFLVGMKLYDLPQAFYAALPGALFLFLVYGVQAIKAGRRGSSVADDAEVFRLSVVVLIYCMWGIIPILLCMGLDTSALLNSIDFLKSSGLLVLVGGKFVIEAVMRSHHLFD